MKRNYFLLFAFLVILSSCKKGDNTITELIVNGSKLTICSYDNVNKNETIALSSLVEDCKLIYFEDIDEAIFKEWFTSVSDKYIGVRQQGGRPYKLFDSSGKFLCDVGAVGQGPGEFSISAYDDLIDEKNERIYITSFNTDKILVFDTYGKFIKNINAPHQLNKPKMHLSEDGILTVVHMAFPNSKAIAIQFDSEGNVINQLDPPQHLLSQSFDGEIFNTRNTTAFDFHNTSSDTLYHFNIKQNKIEPVFTVAFNSSEKPHLYYFELNNLFISNVYNDKKQLLVVNKETKSSSFVKVRNDYFGNMDVTVNILTFRDGWFVWNLEPGQLIEMIEKRLQESDCSEQDKQKLNTLQDSLDENSNNVLFLGKLKK